MGLVDGKVVVITGAGGGLGRAYALYLAREGAKVVVNDVGGARDGTGSGTGMADQVVAEIRAAGGEAVANYDSVATLASAASIIKTAVDSFGRIDVLVNNAGILRDKTLLKMTEEMWDAVIAVHLKGTFACTQAAAARMKEQGTGGSIINTSSYAGLKGNYGQSNYGAAKAGIWGFSLVTALELAKAGIRVNVVAPMAKTRMTEDIDLVPAELTPEQVAPFVAFLASDLSKGVTGRTFGVHGGQIFEYKMEMTEGVTRDSWTPAEIAARLDEIAGLKKVEAPATAPAAVAPAPVAPPPVAMPTTPAEKVAASFKFMPAGFLAEKAGNWKAVLHWEVAGAGDFTVTVADGQCTSSPGKTGNPTCVIKTDAETFVGIGEGTIDGQQAFMKGKITATNLSDLMKYSKVIDPKKARAAFEASLKASSALAAGPAPSAPSPLAPAPASQPAFATPAAASAPRGPSAAEQALEAMAPEAKVRTLLGLLPALGQGAGREARVHLTVGDLQATVVGTGSAIELEAGHCGTPTSRIVAQPEAFWSLWSGKADGASLFCEAKVTATSMEDLRWILRAAGPDPAAALLQEIESRGATMNRACIGKFFHGDPVIVKAAEILAFAEATNDPNPLFVDVGRAGGIVAPPLFPVKFFNQIYRQVFMDGSLGVDLGRLLFGEMSLRFFEPVRPRDLVVAKAQIIGIDDKETGQVLRVLTRLLADGEPRCEAEASFFVRWAARGRSRPWKAKEAVPEATPEVVFEEPMKIREDQTNLFAAAADDPNPIHLDDSFAKSVGLPGRIVHGLCSMAFCGQAFVNRVSGGDPARLLRLKVRFSRPALPGSTLTTRALAPEVRDGVRLYRFEAINDAGEKVITAGEAEIRV